MNDTLRLQLTSTSVYTDDVYNWVGVRILMAQLRGAAADAPDGVTT
jgi:hypothetical protein